MMSVDIASGAQCGARDRYEEDHCTAPNPEAGFTQATLRYTMYVIGHGCIVWMRLSMWSEIIFRSVFNQDMQIVKYFINIIDKVVDDYSVH